MYKCNVCKSYFVEPGTYRELTGEKWNMCPICENADIKLLNEPREIDDCECLELLVFLVASYNANKDKNNGVIEYAIERVIDFITETANDSDLFSELKKCNSVTKMESIIEHIQKIYEEKE